MTAGRDGQDMYCVMLFSGRLVGIIDGHGGVFAIGAWDFSPHQNSIKMAISKVLNLSVVGSERGGTGSCEQLL
jgi:hypothetical protein